MLTTRKQLIGGAVVGGATVAATFAGVATRETAAAAALTRPTRVRSERRPQVSLIAPTRWFPQRDFARDMKVPFSLVFASSEYVPSMQPGLHWTELVANNLSPSGAALGVMAYDLSVPPTEWLKGDAAAVLRRSGSTVDVAASSAPRLRLPLSLDDFEVADSEEAEGVRRHSRWFRWRSYDLGIFAWAGANSAGDELDRVIRSIEVE